MQAQLLRYDETVARHLTLIVDTFPVRACVGAAEVVERLRAHPDALLGLVTGNMPGLVPIKLRAAGFQWLGIDGADNKHGSVEGSWAGVVVQGTKQ